MLFAFLFQLLILLIGEVFILMFSQMLDVYGKYKKLKIYTIGCFFNIFLIKAKSKTERKTISKVSFVYQVCNFIYIFFYIAISVVYYFVYSNNVLWWILVISLLIFSAFSLIGTCVFGILVDDNKNEI